MKRRVLATIVVLVMGTAVASAAAPAPAATQLTVSPSTGLEDLGSVRVEASGFGSDAMIVICQTIAGDASQSDCTGDTIAVVDSWSDGSVSEIYTVRRFVYIGSMGRTVDCADPDERCVISIAESSNVEATEASHGISFAPPGPPPATRGTISVDPATGLTDGAYVRVTGTGFRPNVGVIVDQCIPELRDPTDCTSAYEFVVTDETGAFTVAIFRLFRVFHSRPELRTDCAVDRCVIAAGESSNFPETVATTPLAFRAPDEMPSATVTPDHDLHDGQVVTVAGVNLVPNTNVSVWLCTGDGCGSSALVKGMTDADGAFTLQMTVYRPTRDCDTTQVVCKVIIHNAVHVPIIPVSFAEVPVASPGGATVTEGNDGTTLLEIPVRLSFASDHPVTISWVTLFDSRWSDLAARPGVDYTAANGVVTFAPGETEQTVPISVTGDVTAEGDELLVFGIHRLTNARVAGPWGRLGFGGITDDD